MNTFLTEDRGIVRNRLLDINDFTIHGSGWSVPTVADVSNYRNGNATICLTLKDDLLANLIDIWHKHCGSRLWQDWNLSEKDNDFYSKIRIHAETPVVRVDFRGCKSDTSKNKKVQDALDQINKDVKEHGDNLISAAIQKFNERVNRLVNDRNGWFIRDSVERFSGNFGSYPKIDTIPNRKNLIDEIDRMQEIIKTKRLEVQRLDRLYAISVWEGEDGEKFPPEIRQPVIEKLKASLAKIEAGELITGLFGMVD